MTLTQGLGSLYLVTCKALLPHNLCCALSKPGLVVLVFIPGLLNTTNGESGRKRIPISLYWGSKNVSTLKSSMQRPGWSYIISGFLPGQVAHLKMIVEDQRIHLGSDYNNHPAPPECIIQKDIWNNKGYIYIYICLSNLRAKNLEYIILLKRGPCVWKGPKKRQFLVM